MITKQEVTEWGNFGSPERLHLRKLIDNCINNPSNGSRHEQAIVDFIQVEMNKERLEELWNLYREFCEACNQNNMAPYAVEFFAWISKFKLSKSNE